MIQKYGAADLLTAYKAIAGEPVSQEGQDSGQADSGDQTVSEPVTMVDVAPPVVALLVKNTIPNGCHACSGDYSIFYVKKDGSAFDVLGKWPNIGGQGEFGNAADWVQRTDLSTYPAIMFKGTGMGQGCEMTAADIVELTPTRPIVRAKGVVLSMDYDGGSQGDAGRKHEVGQITRGKSDGVFNLTYKGTATFNATIIPGFGQAPAEPDGQIKAKTDC